MKKLCVSLCILCFSIQAIAQDAPIGNWISYLGTYDVAPRWNVQFNTQARFHNLFGDWDEYLARVGTNYKLDPRGKYSIGIGFDFFHFQKYLDDNSDFKTKFNEYRIYEQFISQHDYKRFYFQHRYRLENRFFEGEDVQFRFRYFLQTKMAINKRRISDNTFYLALINEVFWNFKGDDHFDRLWVQYTLGYRLNKNWTFEVGNQTQFSGQGKYNSRLQFWAFHTMDWRRKAVNRNTYR